MVSGIGLAQSKTVAAIELKNFVFAQLRKNQN